jgi:hypothetical protein
MVGQKQRVFIDNQRVLRKLLETPSLPDQKLGFPGNTDS